MREMRRKRQLLSQEDSVEILKHGNSGILALQGDDGYPYAVPLNYVYQDGKIYFHSAKNGHKIDALKKCGKVSFCVVGQDQVIPEEYTDYFRSVIVFGKIRVLEDSEKACAAIRLLGRKYYPDDVPAHLEQVIDHEWNALCVLELEIEHMTGKEAIELVRRGGLTS